MPVNTPSKAYNSHLLQWQRCRDCFEGSDAVKARGTLYLPTLEGMSDTQVVSLNLARLTPYDAYRMRALFYPAFARTVFGLAGLCFSKPPSISEIPPAYKTTFLDVSRAGTSLLAAGLALCQELLITGRAGILVDLPDQFSGPASPYWVTYRAEQIVSARAVRINGQQQLVRVVLREIVEEDDPDDTFAQKDVEQYRVLELVNGFYEVSTWRQTKAKDGKAGDWAVYDDARRPLRRGQPLNFIPFQFFGPSENSVVIELPPLLALADVNLSHYRTSADHEHGAHFTALPTPWIKGHRLADGETLSIGSGTAWVFPNETAAAGMLEFTGAGLKAISDLKEEKRQMMVSLGARMLETQRNVQEAAQTVRLRHAGERSALVVLAEQESQGLTQVMRWHLWWAGMDDGQADKVSFKLNPDAMDELTADDIRSLVTTWQAGGISHDTLLWNLQWGEWLPPDVTIEAEKEKIKAEGPEPLDPQLLDRFGSGRPDQGSGGTGGAGGTA